MNQHLRPVPPAAPSDSARNDYGGDNDPPSTPVAAPTKARGPRPTKALPTDRMKLEVQKKALSVLATVSEYGKTAATASDMAPRLGVAVTTAGLNNTFFKECGLVLQAGKGKFKSTEFANRFARKFSFDQDAAGLELREPLSDTWFYTTVRQTIEAMGPTTKGRLIEVLAYEAGADSAHRVHLGFVVLWLQYAGLIESQDGDTFALTSPSTPPVADATAGRTDSAEKHATDDPAPEPTPEGATTDQGGARRDKEPETVLGFGFDFSLSGAELAKLSPDQITALFTAVGEVLKIKGALQ